MDFWVSCVIMFFIFILLTPGVLLSLPFGSRNVSSIKDHFLMRIPIFEHLTKFSETFFTERWRFVANTVFHAFVFIGVYYVIRNLVDRTVDCEECEAECPGMRRRR